MNNKPASELQAANTQGGRSPILKCKSHAEMMRVLNWLCDSGIANTSRMSDLEIELGVSGSIGTTLDTLRAAPELLEALQELVTGERQVLDGPLVDKALAAIKKAKG